MGECLAHLLYHRASVGEFHLLRQVADGGVLRDCHLARGRPLQAGYDFQHRRFPGSVLAHEGNPVAAVYDVADVVKQ